MMPSELDSEAELVELLEELDDEPDEDELEDCPGIVSTCPIRISAREFRLFADTIAATVVSWRAAIPDTVSPARTVYLLPDAELLDEELELLELLLLLEVPDDEPEPETRSD